MINKLALKLRDRISKRKPDVLIGGDGTLDGCYMQRWFCIPRNKIFNIYLHKFQHDDDARAVHDHPWINMSYLIEGKYYELTPSYNGAGERYLKWNIRKAGFFYFRKATSSHRIVCVLDQYAKVIPCWTLFITGPNIRTWGFTCPAKNGKPERWVDWKTFTGRDHNKTGSAPSGIGQGCGEDDL